MDRWIDELRADFRGRMPHVVWVVLTVIVSFAGPFGTYQVLDFPTRLAFWSVMMAFVILLGVVVRAFVHGTLAIRSFRLGSPLLALINALILPPVALAVMAWSPFAITDLAPAAPQLGLYVFLTSLGVGACRHAMGHGFVGPEVAPGEGPIPPDRREYPRLVQRLPVEAQGELISISVRDHYVDVVTSAGCAALLMRLSDAMDLVAPVEGARVHRSHWVAWEAVEWLERANGRLVLRLTTGAVIPVSRTYRDVVEVRGIGMRISAGPHNTATASLPISPESTGSSAQSPPV